MSNNPITAPSMCMTTNKWMIINPYGTNGTCAISFRAPRVRTQPHPPERDAQTRTFTALLESALVENDEDKCSNRYHNLLCSVYATHKASYARMEREGGVHFSRGRCLRIIAKERTN